MADLDRDFIAALAADRERIRKEMGCRRWKCVDTVRDLRVEVRRLRNERDEAQKQIELMDARCGYDLLDGLRRRLNLLTRALNQASRGENEDGYAEAMRNMTEALAEVLVTAVGNGRWAALEHESAERLRDGIRQHRERDRSIAEAVGSGKTAPHDEELWALLDDTEEVRRD